MSKKYIFLDVDGVLNCDSTLEQCGGYTGIDDAKVALLKEIVDATEARIVLSSSWRLGYNSRGDSLKGHREYLTQKLSKYGLEIYSMTPQIGRFHSHRGEEIHMWLEAHGGADAWVVLDDDWFEDFNTYGIYPHWIQTYYYDGDGLTESDVQEAIQILNEGVNYDVE